MLLLPERRDLPLGLGHPALQLQDPVQRQLLAAGVDAAVAGGPAKVERKTSTLRQKKIESDSKTELKVITDHILMLTYSPKLGTEN